VIRAAPSPEWAVEAAKQQFAKLEGISDWKIHAALIEAEPVDLEAEPETPPPASSREPAGHALSAGRRARPPARRGEAGCASPITARRR
jgi:hypothetical protein